MIPKITLSFFIVRDVDGRIIVDESFWTPSIWLNYSNDMVIESLSSQLSHNRKMDWLIIDSKRHPSIVSHFLSGSAVQEFDIPATGGQKLEQYVDFLKRVIPRGADVAFDEQQFVRFKIHEGFFEFIREVSKVHDHVNANNSLGATLDEKSHNSVAVGTRQPASHPSTDSAWMVGLAAATAAAVWSFNSGTKEDARDENRFLITSGKSDMRSDTHLMTQSSAMLEGRNVHKSEAAFGRRSLTTDYSKGDYQDLPDYIKVDGRGQIISYHGSVPSLYIRDLIAAKYNLPQQR